jgi:hypothetical protein
MTVKEFKKLLKGLDACELCLRAYDEWGNPHLITTFGIKVLDTFVGFNDPDETRQVIIDPEYDLSDETRENWHGEYE